MNKPMIENSERGVTLNKTLAWSILTSLVGGGVAILLTGLWVGGLISEVQTDLDNLQGRQVEDRAVIRTNTSNIGELQRTNARWDQRLLNIEQSASRTEATVAEILRELRNDQQDQ